MIGLWAHHRDWVKTNLFALWLSICSNTALLRFVSVNHKMQQGLLRRYVMWFMFVGHLSAMFTAPIVIRQFEDALGVILVMLPVTSAIFMFIVQFHQENFFGASSDTQHVSIDAASLTLGLSIVLIFCIHGVLIAYYLGRIGNLETLQRAVSIIDSAVVAYLILLLRRLFERSV